jgi:ribose 5-phosphate isomerase A
MNPKEAAARRAVALVRDGMAVGLGSGSTVDCAIRALGERVREGLSVRLVVASAQSEAAARCAGMSLEGLDQVEGLDLVIDGADECDPHLNLIKGGGAALVREKLLALAGREFVVVADQSKRVAVLGAFPLPVAVVPFGARHTLRRLQRFCPGASLRMRDGRPLVTDDSLRIIDLPFGRIDDPPAIESALKSVAGVVEVGLFTGLADRVILGFPDGHTEEIRRPPGP